MVLCDDGYKAFVLQQNDLKKDKNEDRIAIAPSLQADTGGWAK